MQLIKMVKLNSRSGFSLLEIIIVVVILGIVAALAIPAGVNMTSNTQLRSTADIIKQKLVVARSRAIADPSLACGVYFDITSTPNKVVTFFDDPSFGLRNKYDAGTDKNYLTPSNLDKNIKMQIPATGGIINQVIIFRGDGSAKDGGSINIVNKRGKTRTINILASTGRVKVIIP
jgi:prepilin-type N-terminal cleavage/methylation domain-containing protein